MTYFMTRLVAIILMGLLAKVGTGSEPGFGSGGIEEALDSETRPFKLTAMQNLQMEMKTPPKFGNQPLSTRPKEAYDIGGFRMHPQAQVSIEEVKNVLDLLEKRREALGREPNLLVFGLGHDTDYWRQVTKGKILFLEQYNTPWFPDPCPPDVLAVRYTTTMKESKDAATRDLYDIGRRFLISQRVSSISWDVALVDAPNGIYLDDKRQGKGRVQALWIALQTLARDGYVVVDDFERPLEDRCATEFYGQPFKVAEDPRGRAVPHKQAYFQPHANGKGKQAQI